MKKKSYNHNTNSDNGKNDNDYNNSQNTNDRFKKQDETNEQDDLSFFGLRPNYTLEELKQTKIKLIIHKKINYNKDK